MTLTMTRNPADEILHVLLATEEGRQDPYLLYKALRDIAPLFRSELDGHWYASRYDDCKAILVAPQAGRGPGMVTRYGQNPALAERFTRRSRMTMIMQNPPEHTRLRGVVSRAFTPRRVAGLGERIHALLDPMLDQMAEAGEVDFMAALAFRLPVAVIGELVGVPVEEREQFRELVRITNRASEVGATTADLEAADRAAEYQDAYFADLVARKRCEPDDGLLSALIEIRDSGGPLSEEEMVGTGRLLFGAGFVTTTNLIGNGMVSFFRHPGEMARFWADPHGLAATAVDEILRYESVVQTNGRWVMEPLELGPEGYTEKIDSGEVVIPLVGGANRDPERFPNPERFDVARRGEMPLSFGWGIHHCLGAPLARLEAQTVFTRLAERFSRIEPAGRIPRFNTTFLRGVPSLPVRVTPR
ncbi:MAG TPA: cytochrome P450 [Gemmatimonadales bacterium]|nr:cytochrome P450 [Gemmatimonadales bacterium]